MFRTSGLLTRLAALLLVSTAVRSLGQDVTIRVTNAQEILAALPDNSLALDVLREIDSDLHTLALHRGSDGPSPQDITGQLIRLAAPETVRNFNFNAFNGVATYRLSPVSDFDAFVESIDYGTVVSQNAPKRTVEVKIDVDELAADKLMARADLKGDFEADSLDKLLSGKKRRPSTPAIPSIPGFKRDGAEPTERLGANLAAGDYVEILLQDKPFSGTIKSVKEGSFNRTFAQVQLTETKKLQKLLKRSLRRRLERADSFAFWAPVDRLRRLPGAPTPEPEVRTWTDTTGKFEVVATYQRMDGERVVLRLSSGRETKVPVAKLSDADRAYVESLQTTATNPFASQPSAGGSLRADWRDVKELKLKNSAKWRWKPPQVARPKTAASSVTRIDLDTPVGEGPFGSKLIDLVIAPDGGSAVAVFESGHMTKRPHLQHVNLNTGEAGPLVDCPPDSQVLDVLPDEKLVALTTGGVHNKGTKVFVNRFGKKGLEPFTDFDTSSRGRGLRGVNSARLLKGSRLLVADRSDRWTLWDHKTAKALYTFELDAGFDPGIAIGPEGRFLFIAGSGAIVAIDLSSGKQVASIAHSLGGISELSVDQRLKRLALSSGDKLYTIDLTSGEVIDGLLGLPHDSSVDFVGKFLLIGNRYLCDPKYPLFLWQYVMATGGTYDNHATVRGRKLWYGVRQGQRKGASWTLASISLPHDAVRDRLAEIGDPKDLIILSQGDSVTIKTDTDLDGQKETQLTQAVTQAFQAAGYRIVPAGETDEQTKEVVVVCKKAEKPIEVMIANPDAEPPEDETGAPRIKPPRGFYIPPMRLSGFGGGAFDWMYEPHTVTPYHSSITIRHQGDLLWEDVAQVRDGAQFSPLGKQTVQDILNRLTTADVDRLLQIELPAQICKQGPVGGTFGASLLTGDGIQEDYTGEEGAE